MRDFGLYIVITDPILEYESFCEICVREEVPMLQLREKRMRDKDLLLLTKRLKAATKGSNTKLIINDRADICLMAETDGLHLGSDDLPWQETLSLLPDKSIIGVSTHSVAEATNLIELCKSAHVVPKPDYMSFGPIYPTPAKAIPDAALGTGLLKQMIQIAPLPLIAIGGIFPFNLNEVLAAGARNIAMIRHFTRSREKAELTDKIRAVMTMIKEKTQ
ncbi:MAG: thiamine phosphate synthase [Candidatus Cloacimonadaceae bacterium]|nr:thiamine phosphate synthase [Candidatus Cloacimonadaceae bacterium]